MTFRIPSDKQLSVSLIEEPRTNDLRVVVVETGPEGEPVQTMVGAATPIVPLTGGRGFEIYWSHYVAYVVRNESYFAWEVGETHSGQSGQRQDSAFLNYLAASTIANDDHPGPLKHWFIYADWHCIDVVGDIAPDIRELSPSEAENARARLL